ncbi:MAG: formyl transferase [Bacteroidales bacterium]|nr:formyl transferase [Bacteroidales bacterium]
MIVDVIGKKDCIAYNKAVQSVKRLGLAVYDETYYYKSIAVAPLLTEKITDEQIKEYPLGVLVFHPSPLPYGRGASAIKWAYKRNEPITAATWFFADSTMDGGDICEQEIIKIDYTLRPRMFYEQHIIPAMQRTLERCLNGIQKGFIRRVPQVKEYATFDFKEKNL